MGQLTLMGSGVGGHDHPLSDLLLADAISRLQLSANPNVTDVLLLSE